MTQENEKQPSIDKAEAPEDDILEVKWRKKTESKTAPSTPSPSEGGETLDFAELKRELEAERERVADLQDRWQRTAADLVNLRRRTEQERQEIEQFASMVLVQAILPVLDNFDRALNSVPGNLHGLTWIQGVALIERHLRAILEQQGLAPIDTQGQAFSPHLHEAIAEREADDIEPGTIVQELQRGYTMHGRVIRPSLVEVSKKSESPGVTPDIQTVDEEDPGEPVAEEAENENIGP